MAKCCRPECKAFDSIQLIPALRVQDKTAQLSDLLHIAPQPLKRMLSGIEKNGTQSWEAASYRGSFSILTGDPGIGKSTLLPQIASRLAQNYTVFYFSSEESLEQIKMRARATTRSHSDDYFYMNDEYSITANREEQKPDIIIIDSIQNCSFTENAFQKGALVN